MKTFEIIKHDDDNGIKVYGENLCDLFVNAACGIRDIMVDPGTVRPVRQLNVEVEGESIEVLLSEWLNDIVYLFDTQGLIPASFKVTEIYQTRLLAEVHGEHYDDQVHELRAEMKAGNCHTMSIKKGDGWSATIIFDV